METVPHSPGSKTKHKLVANHGTAQVTVLLRLPRIVCSEAAVMAGVTDEHDKLLTNNSGHFSTQKTVGSSCHTHPTPCASMVRENDGQTENP